MNISLKVSDSPHIKKPRTTRGIMLDVIISLIPALIAGVAIFGKGAFTVVSMSIAAAVLSECLFCMAAKKENTVGDLSAFVTGLLLGLTLPASTPLWQVALGSVFAIVVVKNFFGGLGKNIVNPAITARVFMLVAFKEAAVSSFPLSVDAVGGATPLVEIAEGEAVNLLELLLGNVGGAIGETCKIALILGGIYLLVRRVISWHIPVIYILSSYLFTLCFGGTNLYGALLSTLAGGLIIGAIFMATDYVTSPTTSKGKIVYALGCGFLTAVIRLFSNYPEGVSFAILLMNILTPFIDRLTARKLFGGKAK